MPSSPADRAIVTIREVADFLKVTKRTIYRLAGVKQVIAFQAGGSWRFALKER
jgi:excisionase family DNA binding protein